MTTEEMAEKFVDTLMNKDDSELDKFLNANLGDLKLNKRQAGVLLGIIKGVGICSYLAGLLAGRPQWHDLRKDPDDLPKEVGNYIVCYLDTACEKHTFELSFVDYFEDKHWIDEDNHNIEGFDEGVIAWCEIPKYTEESE